MNKPECINCYYCHFFIISGAKFYECRFNPPKNVVVGMTVKSLWPSVNLKDWCGKYKYNE